MSETKSEYDVQAEAWGAKWGVRMTATFTGHRKYFAGDTDTRDVYWITLTRVYPSPHANENTPITRVMSFDFGASLNDSRVEPTSVGPYWKKRERDHWRGGGEYSVIDFKAPNRKRIAPSLYDIIACMEKNDVGTFEDWCSDVGADTDSRKALETYLSCQKQAEDFRRLCGGDAAMMREAQEIQ